MWGSRQRKEEVRGRALEGCGKVQLSLPPTPVCPWETWEDHLKPAVGVAQLWFEMLLVSSLPLNKQL